MLSDASLPHDSIMGPSSQVELKFRIVGFLRGRKRKTGAPREKPSKLGEKQKQTQPTKGNRPESNSGHSGER